MRHRRTSRRVRTLVAAVLLCLAFAALQASPAQALRGGEFFGLHPWSTPSESEHQRIRLGRVGTIRIPILWLRVEPTRGARDWSYYDDQVAKAARHGIRIFPNFLGSPSFAARNPRHPPRASAMRAYLRFVTDAVRRYGTRGAFWAQNPGLPRKPITHWQIWNEVGLNFYWNGRANVRQYAAFLKRNYTTIKRADRRAKVVLSGLPESTASRGSNIRATRYLAALYRIRGIARYFDVVALHPYASGVRGVSTDVRRMRSIMARARDSRTELWITEIGFAGSGPRSPYTSSPRGQASRMTSSYSFITRNRRRYRLGFVSWFSWRDPVPVPGTRVNWTLHSGMFTVNGDMKPVWRAFMRFTRGNAGTGGLGEPPPPPQPPGGEGGPGGGGSSTSDGGAGGSSPPPPDDGGGGGTPPPPPPPSCPLPLPDGQCPVL